MTMAEMDLSTLFILQLNLRVYVCLSELTNATYVLRQEEPP